MSERISEDQIRDLVVTFYHRVQADTMLGPVFEARLEGRWEPHLEKMCDFWSTVLLGTRRFRGNPMQRHVGLPGICPEHFSRWMDLFDDTAYERLPEHIAADVIGRAARMRVALERAACGTPVDDVTAAVR